MLISGLMKMTLLDFPGKVACTVFTGGCNLRCPFCHNAALVTEIDPSAAYSAEDIIKFLKTRQGLLDGVCITGGEPLLQRDIGEFISAVKQLGFKVKLDTNGFFPEKLKRLTEAELVDYVAMDVKNTFAKYPMTAGIENLDIAPVKESIALLKGGSTEYEFRTTVVKEFHTPEDIEEIAAKISGAERYFLQNFEDSGKLIGGGMHAASPDTLSEMLSRAKKHVPAAALRGV